MRHTHLAVLAIITMLSAATAFAEILPGGAAGVDFDVTLENGATIGPDPQLGTDVLTVNGDKGCYARWPVPEDWGRLRNFRVDIKVRLDQIRASTIPIALPGSFMIYLSGEGKPWFMFFHDGGRSIVAAEDPILPTVWNDIAFEYRADDVCLLYVNGRSVASCRGRGPLAQPEGDLWFGRYYWKDPEDQKEYEAWMRGAVAKPTITILPDDDRFVLDTTGMENVMAISWGDFIVLGEGWRKLQKPEHVAQLVEEIKARGVTKVFWRCSHEFIMSFCERRMDEDHWYLKAYKGADPSVHDELIRQCHEAGIKVYAWNTIFDEGSPTTVLYGGNTPYFWQSHFTIEHPEYLMENRDGTKRQWGVMCYAYPEARQYIINVFKHMMEKWDFDGLYICTRTHSYPAEFADQFGYNQPIVDEFKRRHGVDIRTQDFSKSQWYDLQGEYLTQLIREFRQEFGDKKIVVGIPRSEYIGAPYGNMRLDWRTWTQEKLIDGLRIGTISGAFHYPDTRNRPGYIQDQQDSIALRDLEYDLGTWFGPACKEAGVELHLDWGNMYSDEDRDLLKLPGVTGFAVGL